MKRILLIGLLSLIASIQASAAQKPITCQTGRGNKTFQIVGNQVSISIGTELDSPRSPASILNKARHKLNGKGITKILFFEGNKHTIHIENVNDLNSIDDYVTIRTNKGHQITYPLSCSY